jgi:hypothetical protein
LDFREKLVVSFRVVRQRAGRSPNAFTWMLRLCAVRNRSQGDFYLLPVSDLQRPEQLDRRTVNFAVNDLAHESISEGTAPDSAASSF